MFESFDVALLVGSVRTSCVLSGQLDMSNIHRFRHFVDVSPKLLEPEEQKCTQEELQYE